MVIGCLLTAFVAGHSVQTGSSGSASGGVDISVADESGPELRSKWARLPIPIYLSNTIPAALEDDILEGLYMWEDALGMKLWDYRGKIDSDTQVYEGMNIVYWDNEPNQKGFLGLTMFKVLGAQLIEADITFFGEPEDYIAAKCEDAKMNCIRPTGRYDIITTTIHEAGHALGLSDTVATDSVMNPYFGRNSVRQKIDETSISNILNGYDNETFGMTNGRDMTEQYQTEQTRS